MPKTRVPRSKRRQPLFPPPPFVKEGDRGGRFPKKFPPLQPDKTRVGTVTPAGEGAGGEVELFTGRHQAALLLLFLGLFFLGRARLVEHLVNNTVIPGLLGIEIKVAVGIVGDLIHRLAGMVDENVLNDILLPHYLAGGDDDIGRLSLGAAGR